MMKLPEKLLLASIVFASFAMVWRRDDSAMLYVMGGIVGLLLLFSGVWRVMEKRQLEMAEEIRKRTVTWWWMAAVFMLALAFHRMVSFLFLGLLCFSAMREYFSLVPMTEKEGTKTLSFKDRPSILLGYASIPLMIYLAYIRWYELFMIAIPVYVFLVVPIIFVLQNRTAGSLKSLGVITVGLMFFAHNLGHCLFMINAGPILVMFCFVLTEVRDLFSFWLGKSLAALASQTHPGPVRSFLEWRIAPAVSPNKTWATGLLSAVLVAILALVFVPIMPEFPLGRLSYEYSLLIGFLIGIFGLFGDLVFSMIKRDLNSKDSGTLLPGHGGVIDRVDSLVFTIPITFHLIYWKYF